MPSLLVPGSGRPGLSRGRLAIAVVSTVVEWYDFTLFLFLSSVLSRVFLGDSPTGVLMTLTTFAVSYLLRPVGGLVFGYVGDRWGRRPVLLASMALIFLATAGMAALPTFAQVGESAALWLLALRCVMAFSVGGEYTGVMTYLLESSTARHRGLVTSLAAAASEIGALLAAGISALTVLSLSASQVEEWGWRIPFVVGGVLAAVILALRSALPETPLFLQSRLAAQREPIVHILRRQWRAVVRTFFISGLCSAAYYVGIIYLPTYLISVQAWSESSAMGLATLAAGVVVLTSPVAGWLSDRYGRRATLLSSLERRPCTTHFGPPRCTGRCVLQACCRTSGQCRTSTLLITSPTVCGSRPIQAVPKTSPESSSRISSTRWQQGRCVFRSGRSIPLRTLSRRTRTWRTAR